MGDAHGLALYRSLRLSGNWLTLYHRHQCIASSVIFASPNWFVAVLVPLAIIATVVVSLETIVLMAVRIVFAWSFDGVTPVKLAEVSEKKGSPNYALALVAIVGLIYVLLSIFAAQRSNVQRLRNVRSLPGIRNRRNSGNSLPLQT